MIFFTSKEEKEKFLKIVTHLDNYHKSITEYESQFEVEALMNRAKFLVAELERINKYEEQVRAEIDEIKEKLSKIEEIDVQSYQDL